LESVEGYEVSSKQLGLLDDGETASFAARPSYATVRIGSHWSSPLLLLTDRRLVISKDRAFGKPKADFSAPWAEIHGVSGSLWNGGGPQIQLVVQSTRGEIELIVEPLHAVDVESAIRRGYLQ
jgi:hypothetical protein